MDPINLVLNKTIAILNVLFNYQYNLKNILLLESDRSQVICVSYITMV